MPLRCAESAWHETELFLESEGWITCHPRVLLIKTVIETVALDITDAIEGSDIWNGDTVADPRACVTCSKLMRNCFRGLDFHQAY